MAIQDIGTSNLFVTFASRRASMDSLAQRLLSRGLESFVAKRYDEAIDQFRRAAGLAPGSDTAINAHDYMARSYLAKRQPERAIQAYEQAIRINPQRTDTLISLAKLYITLEKPEKAVELYEKVVAQDPSAANRYSLGQTYLESGRLRDAEAQFQRVRELEPGKPNGEYGLGLSYARQGRTEDAVAAFERALVIEPDFNIARVELGYALADLGNRDQAQDVVRELQSKAEGLANTLSQYIYEKTPPAMVGVDPSSTFPRSRGAGTLVSSLSAYLSDPGAQQTFSMKFLFSKPMDVASVQNVFNWNITRSQDTGKGDGYNFGFAVPTTEVALARYPVSVSYDVTYRIATVFFSVQQTEGADGTLDPSHIKFSFTGKDATGLAMDPTADEYTRFSGFA